MKVREEYSTHVTAVRRAAVQPLLILLLLHLGIVTHLPYSLLSDAAADDDYYCCWVFLSIIVILLLIVLIVM